MKNIRSVSILAFAFLINSMAARGMESVQCVPDYAKPMGQCIATGQPGSGTWTLRANVVVDRHILVGGAVEIKADGTIGKVACDGELPSGPMLDCPGTVVTAGLINLHEHLNYSTGRPLPPPLHAMQSHHDWQRDPSIWGGQEVIRTGRREPIGLVELRYLLGGTTTIAGRGQAKGLTRNPDAGWFPAVTNVTFPFGRSTAQTPAGCDSRRILKGDRPTLVHAGEGTDDDAAAEMDCLLASREAYLQTEPLVFVHAMNVDAARAEHMARAHVSVLWSPRSNMVLYGTSAPIALLRRHGVPVSLGTDWLPSGSPTLLDEARFARALVSGSDAIDEIDLLDMMTTSPAAAIGMQAHIGRITQGAYADLAGFRLRGDASDAVHSVIEARPADTAFVMVGGALRVVGADARHALREAIEADHCVELPKGQCLPDAYACGPGYLRSALVRTDALGMLCPALDANAAVLQ
ncbi:amidohydrolase family protein [Luteibacter aegosomatis]|uniref:amidohydrolase family protein n=1 Tax=Luteibacter aegosomatis TaxID=2911537 RepID=UPI001FFA75C7|nr:amidohydrolase family protein [Luteibacter aegosomatis]UPG85817.1 amidohydrolase family protein [Luteibacter aegosomatis]